jgi:serine phosphatase RsbU (regulator of sigma subunit)
MKYLSLLSILTLSLICRVSSQETHYPITNYTTKDYGRDFHPTNLAIVQDQRGVIYAANGFKLLEFDGSVWKSYPINREIWILSLAVDSSGLIYAGSQNEFGVFEPDFRGELKYRSLSDSLDIRDVDFTNIWMTHALSGGVVFQAEEKIFLYRNGKIGVVYPETSFHTSFVVNDRLFVRQRAVGLMELKDGGLEKVRGGELFDSTGIFLMVPFDAERRTFLIGTREKGFWLFKPDDPATPFSQFEIADYPVVQEAIITGGVLAGEGEVAISTTLGGVIVIDNEGNIKEIIDNSKGLADNDVKQLLSDRCHNLWLAHNNGISRVEISSPLTSINETSGISGSINALVRYENLLYAGTTSGLFVQNGDPGTDIPFKPAFSFTASVRSLVLAEGSLIAGTDEGLFRIFNGRISRIGDEKSYTLYYSDRLKILFSGGPVGLRSYRNDGVFRVMSSLAYDGEDIIGISPEDEVSDREATVIWLGTRYNGVVKLRIENDFSFTADSYNTADGLPDGWVIPARFNSKTIFETQMGLYGFTDEKTVRESVPDSLRDNKEFTKGYFSVSSDISDRIGKPFSFPVEGGSKIWFRTDNSVGYLDRNDGMSYVSTPFLGIETGRINYIYPEEDGICWLGTTDGLIKYDENVIKDYDPGYHTLIRKIVLTGTDSTLFKGTFFSADQEGIRVLTEQPAGMSPKLTYSHNSVRIEFSALFYEYPGTVSYSYKLEGLDSRWSQWTHENFREYTNLREGNYTFIVKARNVYDKESIPAKYSFVIFPPWYRSWAAYAAYAIMTLILFWLVVRLYTYRLKRENIRLEGIVAERTAEVVRQKNEIEHKNVALEIQKKEIEDSIRYARRIQSAVIPSEETCIGMFPESFVLFRPLNIVSGDFYWISRTGDKIVFAVADCTGHGVPGAFMSMLGVAFLNEIVNKDNITDPDLILNLLREKVISALQQQGISGEARDGMDIALVCIDRKLRRLEYAGAYNPLIMIRKGEIIETKADKMPIGIYEKMDPFTKHAIQIEKGDRFYMFSDGYQDQFGGVSGEKFKTRRLKALLLEIHQNSMKIQKEILEKTLEEWKGECQQIDDIVLAGLAID